MPEYSPMDGTLKIALIGWPDSHKNVLLQAMQHHMRHGEICADADQADLVITADFLPAEPVRVGALIDHLDKQIFLHQYPDEICYADYTLYVRECVVDIAGQDYALGHRETSLMAELLKAGAEGCARDDLLNKVWDYRSDLETHALETQIYRLRQKIEDDPENPKRIMTLEGGYGLR